MGEVGGVVSRAPSSGVVTLISAVGGKLSLRGTAVAGTWVDGGFVGAAGGWVASGRITVTVGWSADDGTGAVVGVGDTDDDVGGVVVVAPGACSGAPQASRHKHIEINSGTERISPPRTWRTKRLSHSRIAPGRFRKPLGAAPPGPCGRAPGCHPTSGAGPGAEAFGRSREGDPYRDDLAPTPEAPRSQDERGQAGLGSPVPFTGVRTP